MNAEKRQQAIALRQSGKRLREIAAELGVSVGYACKLTSPPKKQPIKCTAAKCQFPAHGVRRISRARYVCACCHADQSLASVFCWDASDGKTPRLVP